jgi:ribosome-associated protein
MTDSDIKDNRDNDNDEEDLVSKSQLKRDSHALQDMGSKLVEMPLGQLAKFSLPDNLKDAITEARRLKNREGKRRQMQYIGKLMRTADISFIQETLERMDHQSQTYRQHFMQLEALRDRLISQGNPVIEELMEQYPSADRQQLRNLQRQAARELELKKTPTASKKIFAYLRQLSE